MQLPSWIKKIQIRPSDSPHPKIYDNPPYVPPTKPTNWAWWAVIVLIVLCRCLPITETVKGFLETFTSSAHYLPNAVHADAIEKWQMDFQDPASPIMEGIINLHHDVMFFLVLIGTFVSWMLFRTVYLFNSARGHKPSTNTHGTVLEIVWTIIPSFVLLIVAIPSFALLYAVDEASDPAITIKVIGHQWYWVYEYSDYNTDSKSITFESYMVPEADLKLGQLRLLEVDNRVVVPTNTHIRFLITATDVLHSWAVPSLGVKLDACPGRLNQATVFIKRDGVYYGQCSEICGVNHGFMPIVVESVPLDEYVSWVASHIEA
jgi:cytochrome c oxidase subunit 2